MTQSDKAAAPKKPKRTLAAAKLGPWDILTVLMRYQAGECVASLQKIYGISHQTINRWDAAWGHQTRHIHLARLALMQQVDMEKAAQVVAELKAHADRTSAILHRTLQKSVARKEGAVTVHDRQETSSQQKLFGSLAYRDGKTNAKI